MSLWVTFQFKDVAPNDIFFYFQVISLNVTRWKEILRHEMSDHLKEIEKVQSYMSCKTK